MNPLSQQMQAQGRGNDSVLVHMSPREVGGLQALAQSYGGTLTRNPTTGLPEAGFLEKLLPAIAGAVGGAMGIDPWMAAAGAGLAQGAITGNLEKGLTAGLSAYGGASLGRSFNPEGTFAGYKIGTPIPTPSLEDIDPGAATAAGATSSPDPINQSANSASGVAPTIPLTPPTPPAPQGMFDKFGTAASAGITNSTLQNLAPYAAAFGLATPFLTGSDQTYKAPEPKKTDYAGPYKPVPRVMALPVRGSNYLRNSSEHMFFPDSNPYPGYLPADKTTPESEIDLNALAKRLGRVAPTIRMAEGGLLPRAAPRTGLIAPEAPRSSGERTFNFPKSNYVPPAAPPSAGLQALTQQYPTATKAQLSEYERAIAGGGDPSATRSLMQAYGPTSNYTSLQPWSPDFKGFDYKRSRPTDEFGNPIGWTPTAEEQASADNAMGRARMSMEGITEPDSDFLAGFRGMIHGQTADYSNPSWGMNVETFKGAPPMLKDSMFNRATGYTGSGSDGQNYANTYDTYKTNQIVEGQRQAAMAANAADNTAENYALYGGPDAPEDTGRYVSPVPSSPPASSGAQGVFNRALEATRAAPGATSTGIGAMFDRLGNKVGAAVSDIGNIGNMSRDELWNFASKVAPFTPLSPFFNAANLLIGGAGYTTGDGRSGFTSNPGMQALPRELTQGHIWGAIQNMVPFNLLGTHEHAANPKGQAAGGVNLEDGSFVVDARTVAELGNGSSGAGQEVLARLGGRPIHGPGDGVSDSIRANIGGTQEARVARDEVKFDPEAVKRLGRGNPKKGADRLYDMMKKAEKARKSASRGKDTGLRALAGAR